MKISFLPIFNIVCFGLPLITEAIRSSGLYAIRFEIYQKIGGVYNG